MRIESGNVSWSKTPDDEYQQMNSVRWQPPPSAVAFVSPFRELPVVVVGIAGLKAGEYIRLSVAAEDVSALGFKLVFNCERSAHAIDAFWVAYGE